MKTNFLPTKLKVLLKAFILFVFMGSISKIAHTQSLIIGSSTTNTNGSSPDPLDRFGNFMHYQIVYLASELSAGGMSAGSQITALGFSVSESPSSLANFTISMGQTTQTLANPYISSGLSIVKTPFTYTPTAQPASSFDMINFDTPFTWNGLSNIVVNTCTGSNTINTPYGGLRYTVSSSGIARYIRSNVPTNCATATSTNSQSRPNIKFNYINQSCSGVPTPGNTLSSANPVCPNQLFTLSLQNINLGSGLSYQWYKDNTAIVGATNITYATFITSNSDFYCEVNCYGNIASSNPLSINVNSFLNCYCISQAAVNSDEEIYNVIVNGDATNPLYANLNACTTVAPGPGSLLGRYSNFKTLGSLTHFAPGASIPFAIVENECDGPQFMPFGTAIWIDYNQNGSFTDAGEQVFVEPNAVIGPRTISGIITVPATAIPGCTAMRITVAENIAGSSLTPCLSYAYGETEDYMICIDSTCQGSPNVGVITPHYNNPCDSNASIELSINGNNNVSGIAYQWEVSSTPTGPWVTISGSTSQTYTIPSPIMPSYYNCIETCTTSMLSSAATPIIIQPYPPLTIELDTVYCNGQNSQGQHLYHYVLHVNNATYSNAIIASITSLDGTIVSVSSTTVLPGMNVISGDVFIGSSVLTKHGFFCFKINLVHPPSTDTCYKTVCMVIPNCAVNVCDSNRLRNGTFSLGISAGPLSGAGNVNFWQTANGNPWVVNFEGCDEQGYLKLQGNKHSGDAIKQGLIPGNKIVKNNWYSVRMCLRIDSTVSINPSFKVRVMAFNGTLPSGIHPPPSASATIMGFTGLIRTKEWTTVELDSWYAYKDFDSIAINIFNNDTLINSVGYIDGVCLHTTTDTCDCAGLDRDSLGNFIIPEELLALMDTTDQTIDTVDMLMGSLDDIYGDWDTNLDTFYHGTPDLCCLSIGGTIPEEAEDFDGEDSLAALGVLISMDSVKDILSHIEDSIAGSLITNFPNFEDKFGLLSGIPGIQIDSLCVCDSTTSSVPLDPGSPFQGMDIILVHGLDDSGITQAIINFSSFYHNTKWPDDLEEFYNNYHGNGYYGKWKEHADQFWHNHINHYLKGKGYKNRYLTIAWPSTQRLPFSTHAMLSQIYEAMSNGQGVELLDPYDIRGQEEFGKNGFVIMSHSTGGLITNVTMAVANQTKTIIPLRAIFGPAYRISDKAKLHIAMHTALSGSNWAPLTIGITTPALAGLAVLFDFTPPFTPAYALTTLNSILVDLCPRVSQFNWMYPISALNLNPVPTLTTAGGDPGNFSPINNLMIKKLLLPGFDDGVLTLECQIGNPIPASLANIPPFNSYFNPYGAISAPGIFYHTSKLKLVDMANKPYRAISFYITQTKEEHSVLGAAAASSTPFISTTGMVQPYSSNSFVRNSLLRYTNHYSFLQSTSYHNSGPNGKAKWNNPYASTHYAPSFGETNNEEESVITNNAVYVNGIVSPSFHGLMERTVKGPHKTIKFKVPFCKKCKTYSKTFWIWKRNYDRLHGFENLMECDYIYQYVLKP